MWSRYWISPACFAGPDPTGLMDAPRFPTALVEARDGSLRWAQEQALTREGFRVHTCPGPSRLKRGCPLVKNGACSLVDEADVIITSMGAGDDEECCVLEALGSSEAPVIALVPGPTVDRSPGLFQGFHVLREPVSRRRLLDAVNEVTR